MLKSELDQLRSKLEQEINTLAEIHLAYRRKKSDVEKILYSDALLLYTYLRENAENFEIPLPDAASSGKEAHPIVLKILRKMDEDGTLPDIIAESDLFKAWKASRKTRAEYIKEIKNIRDQIEERQSLLTQDTLEKLPIPAEDTRVGYIFHTSKEPPAQTQEPIFGQTQSHLQELKDYLTPENQRKHHIQDVKIKTRASTTITELEIHFEKPDHAPVKTFVKNGASPDSLVISITKGLPEDDFALVAKRTAEMFVSRAKPGAEFDLTLSPDEKKCLVLNQAFEEAITKALTEEPPRFTELTKPKIKPKSNRPKGPS